MDSEKFLHELGEIKCEEGKLDYIYDFFDPNTGHAIYICNKVLNTLEPSSLSEVNIIGVLVASSLCCKKEHVPYNFRQIFFNKSKEFLSHKKDPLELEWMLSGLG